MLQTHALLTQTAMPSLANLNPCLGRALGVILLLAYLYGVLLTLRGFTKK